MSIAGQAGSNIVVDTNREVAQSEHVLGASPTDLWPHLRDAFTSLEVEVTEVKRTERIMGNPRFRPRRVDGERLSTFIDCGRDHAGAYADQHEVWLTFMAQLLPAPGGESRLITLVTGSARPRAVSGSDLPCQSNGVLEGRLVAALTAALAG